MKSFTYHKPATIADAVALLSISDTGSPLAGGMTLLPTMKQRLASPETIVDLSGIVALRGIRLEGDALVIGAMTRHADVAASDLVAAKLPGLARLAARIGDQQVRHRGTIGGSVANNDPAADYPSAILALDAEIITDRRRIAADDFFLGMFETALEPGEIITGFRIPIPEMSAYSKFGNPASRYALAGVFVAKTASGIRVAVTGAGSSVFRPADIENALGASFTPEALDRISIDATSLLSDIHADREYRAHLVMVMAKRAVALALKIA
ncbi:MAG: xanthine dehydrogenase family protein subunit M [Rhizobium sp.]|nr:xanthine dehydrogenase family protein subunit M [Rhizobium sp.]